MREKKINVNVMVKVYYSGGFHIPGTHKVKVKFKVKNMVNICQSSTNLRIRKRLKMGTKIPYFYADNFPRDQIKKKKILHYVSNSI